MKGGRHGQAKPMWNTKILNPAAKAGASGASELRKLSKRRQRAGVYHWLDTSTTLKGQMQVILRTAADGVGDPDRPLYLAYWELVISNMVRLRYAFEDRQCGSIVGKIRA